MTTCYAWILLIRITAFTMWKNYTNYTIFSMSKLVKKMLRLQPIRILISLQMPENPITFLLILKRQCWTGKQTLLVYLCGVFGHVALQKIRPKQRLIMSIYVPPFFLPKVGIGLVLEGLVIQYSVNISEYDNCCATFAQHKEWLAYLKIR